MSKKKKLVMTSMALGGVALTLTGCGAKSEKQDDTASQKNKPVKIEVKQAQYVKPEDKTVEGDDAYLALKVSIKNTSKYNISFNEDDLKLYDKDKESIKPEMLYFDSVDDDKLSMETIDSDSTASGWVYYKVDKGDKYTMKYKPQIDVEENTDKKLPTTTLAINTNKYKDQTKAIQDAAKGYVDAVFFGDTDAAKKANVANDVATAQTQFNDAYKKALLDQVFEGTSDEDLNRFIQAYKEAAKQKDKVEYTVASYDGQKAVVNLKVNSLLLDDYDMDATLDRFIEENAERYADADEDRIEQDASKYVLDDMIKWFPSATANSTSEDVELTLVRKDGKWEVETTDEYTYRDVEETFMGGLYIV